MLKFKGVSLAVSICAISLGAQASSAGTKIKKEKITPGVPAAAKASLKGPQGEAMGTVTFKETAKGVEIAVQATGLTPGQHGIHFHQTGKCEGPDFKSAGSHFAPKESKHGLESEHGPHAGDLPNIEAKKDGTAVAQFSSDRVTLKKDASHSLLKKDGTAIMIHAQADDQKTDPSGGSGDRIACGVIEGMK